ncbi:MAG TPA: GNAT family N-acetyltransferase [Tepidisphaeraceae bacterium]|jgi:GNAT superfamily N-acetyltransferase|nr:GNAT family N-acetyltransferase [Tepidisphaeraceae bacterium]
MTQSADAILSLNGSEAILAVSSVVETVRYYREVLGFQGQWLWGDPPTFGGLSWGKAQIMLCQQPELASKVEGHQHWFSCDEISELHDRHRATGAEIVSAIEDKPWGQREYTVRDINGYHLRFGGPIAYKRPPNARSTLPEFIALEERLPTVDEYSALMDAIGWNKNTETVPMALANSLFGVVALDKRQAPGKQVAGSVRVIGDAARVFYVQDVMVMPALQNQHIGAAMMEAAVAWLRRSAPRGAMAYLFTGKPAFYERFGFKPNDGGMSLGL